MIRTLETGLKILLLIVITVVISGAAFTYYFDKCYLSPMLEMDKKLISQNVARANSKTPINNYDDIVAQTNAFYNQQFSSLLWILGTVVTIFGIGVPLALSFFQHLSLQEDRKKIDTAAKKTKGIEKQFNRFKNEIELLDARRKLLDLKTSFITSSISQIFCHFSGYSDFSKLSEAEKFVMLFKSIMLDSIASPNNPDNDKFDYLMWKISSLSIDDLSFVISQVEDFPFTENAVEYREKNHILLGALKCRGAFGSDPAANPVRGDDLRLKDGGKQEK